jgi:hypothetical protein
METLPATIPQRAPMPAIDQGKDEDYFKPERLRRQYNDYLGAKQAETDEMRQARHYYHGDQWTSDEIEALRGASSLSLPQTALCARSTLLWACRAAAAGSEGLCAHAKA